MASVHGLVLVAAALVSTSLQGCGPSQSPSQSPTTTTILLPTTTTSTTMTTTTTTMRTTTMTTTTSTTTSPAPTPAPPPPHGGWNLAPIEVRGQRLFNSVTGEEFHPKGIAMPVVGESVAEWVRVLKRIHTLAPEINLVRIYELPTCALEGPCFKLFMQYADRLGIYVLVPGTGTGTTWGWLPSNASACKNGTADGCYSAGNVLTWGQKIVQNFNYPNTLAIVIGNEFDWHMLEFIPVLKAYARDLKSYMSMCNANKDSPSHGQMRQIPLMYANSDDQGDAGVRPKADYLFCDSGDVSVDIFGLNVERWCEDAAGREQYDKISSWVGERRYPGAFLFSEMGCDKTKLPVDYNGSRTWNQVPGFFANFTGVAGFVAYTYHGNKDFEMFDGPTAEADVNQDGGNYFEKLKRVGSGSQDNRSLHTVVPECPKTILNVSIGSYSDVRWYNTGETGWAPSCPQPWNSSLLAEAVAETASSTGTSELLVLM